MLEIFRLIRVRTIIFAAFLLYAMRYFVVRAILDINGFCLQLPNWAFSLSVVSVCCLIAGAYVINDYFDVRADRISAVKDVVVGRHISRRAAMSLHSVLNVIAVGLAFFLSFWVGVWKIGILFLLVSGLLWFYSSSYKKYFLIGNLIVGLLGASIPFVVLLFEIPLLNVEYFDILTKTNTDFMYLFSWIGGFSYFLLLNTLLYEMNKDIYTVSGDREKGIRSLPIKWGIKCTKSLMTVLVAVALGSIAALYAVVFSASPLVLGYLVLLVCLPYLLYLFFLWTASGKRRLQLWTIRFIMVSCIIFSFLLHHFFTILFAD